jgi:hypothetical protein
MALNTAECRLLKSIVVAPDRHNSRQKECRILDSHSSRSDGLRNCSSDPGGAPVAKHRCHLITEHLLQRVSCLPGFRRVNRRLCNVAPHPCREVEAMLGGDDAYHVGVLHGIHQVS